MVLEVSGGSYRDEATGAEVALSQPMRACLPAVTADTSVAITPLTEVAVRIAEDSGLSAETITSANTQISELLGSDIVTTQPANPEDAEAFEADTPEAKNYAIALAAISQMAETSAEDVFTVIDALEEDAQDSELDTIGDDFIQAVDDFLESEENNTGVEDVEDLDDLPTTIVKKYGSKQAHFTCRVYESGQRYVMATVDLTKSGGPIAETDVVSRAITAADDTPLTPDSSGYYLMQYIGRDCSTVPGTCTTTAPLRRSGLWDVFGTLDADTYAMTITMENDQVIAVSDDFPGAAAVPYISGATMTAQWSGVDLQLSWTNPTAEALWDEVDLIRVIATDNSGNETLHISLPPDSQTVTITDDLMQQAASLLGGTALVQWQVQTLALDDNGMKFARDR